MQRNNRSHGDSDAKTMTNMQVCDGEDPSRLLSRNIPAALASWLCDWLIDGLRSPPTLHPGMKPCLCRDASALDCLSAAPREAIYVGLVHPELIMKQSASRRDALTKEEDGMGSEEGASTGGDKVQPQKYVRRDRAREDDITAGSSLRAQEPHGIHTVSNLGIHEHAEDVCIAFQLFDSLPECTDIKTWYASFCEIVRGTDMQTSEPYEDRRTKSKREGAGDKKKKKRGRPHLEDENNDDLGPERDENDVQLAARFVQAASELQMMGLIKAVKRRDGEIAKRAVHMPAPWYGM